VSSPIDFQKVINKNSKVDKFPCRRQCKIFWRTSLLNPPHTWTQITGYRHGRAYIISRRHCVTGTDSPAKTGTRNRFFTFLLPFSFLFIFPLQKLFIFKNFPKPAADRHSPREGPSKSRHFWSSPIFIDAFIYLFIYNVNLLAALSSLAFSTLTGDSTTRYHKRHSQRNEQK
jgi:hypothetical protein